MGAGEHDCHANNDVIHLHQCGSTCQESKKMHGQSVVFWGTDKQRTNVSLTYSTVRNSEKLMKVQ